MANLLHLKGSRTQVLKTLPTNDTGNDGDIVVSAIQGRGIYLCIKANNRWYVSTKLEELRKIGKTTTKDLKVDRIKIGNTTIAKNKFEVDVGKNDFKFLLDTATISGMVSCYFDGNTYASHRMTADTNNSYFRMWEDGGTGNDLFQIAVAATGDTTLSTTDVDGVGGADFTIDAEGHIELDCDAAGTKAGNILFSESGTTFAVLDTSLTASQFTLYEAFGASDDDYFKISCFVNGATTIATVDTAAAAAHLTLDVDGDILMDAAGGDVTITSADVSIAATKKLFFDGGTDTYITESSADVLDFYVGALNILKLDEANDKVEVGGAQLELDATKGLFFDGGGDTYIYEQSADNLRIVVGADVIMHMAEKGDDGNEVKFGACVGFEQLEPTYDATTTVVDFRFSNKQFVTFDGGSITNISLFFPLVSGNFVLLLKQDGTGSRTVTNWKCFEFDESSADGAAAVKFAGGSNPTLTTDANHVDILSFYWDADNEIAYGVATLDFQF